MTVELEAPAVAGTPAAPAAPAARTPWRATTAGTLTRRAGELARQPILVLAWVIVLVVIGWAIAPHLFTSYSPYLGDNAASFAPPSAEHWFGTDRLGRDLFARSVYGARTTLTATLLAVLIAFGIGTVVGLIAGFAGGLVDTAVMRVIDVFLAIPSLLLAMVVVSVLGYSTHNIALAVGISSIASFARVMRAEVLAVVTQDYVKAAYGVGVGRLGVMLRHVVPNSLSSSSRSPRWRSAPPSSPSPRWASSATAHRHRSRSGGSSSRRAATSSPSTRGRRSCPASPSRCRHRHPPHQHLVSEGPPPMSETPDPLLRITDLTVEYRTGRREWTPAVRGAAVHVEPGEFVSLVGVVRLRQDHPHPGRPGLLPAAARIRAGSIAYSGVDVTGWNDRRMALVRGNYVGFIPQDPNTSLNPVKKIGQQVIEAVRFNTTGPAARSPGAIPAGRPGQPAHRRAQGRRAGCSSSTRTSSAAG